MDDQAKAQVGRRVAIVGGVRIPFQKVGGLYSELSGLDLMVAALQACVDRFDLKGQTLGDVCLGTTFYHPMTWNLAREAVLKTNLHPHTPGLGTQRACATSLDATCLMAMKIARGNIDVAIAGGTETASDFTMFLKPHLARLLLRSAKAKSFGEKLKLWRQIHFKDLTPRIAPTVEPSTGKSMGEHCEMMAKHWKIDRRSQDELAFESHKKGVAAYGRGFYKDLVIPFMGADRDGLLRANTSVERLGKLPPAFDHSGDGTLTAGNSTPLTDGASCVLLASEEYAKSRGLPILAYFTDFETAAIDPNTEGLLMAPVYAMSRMLTRNKLNLGSFDFYEIHEAFSAQVLCTLKAWESEQYCQENLGRSEAMGSIDRAKLNVAGGSVALGHPFGATGARIVATAAKLLAEKGSGRAVMSICTGGGMGTTAIIERD